MRLALKSLKSGHQLKLLVDLFQRCSSKRKESKKKSVQPFDDQTPGHLTADDRGTLWITDDDRWVKRSNNDTRRTGILWRERLSREVVARLMMSTLNGGIPGTGDPPAHKVRRARIYNSLTW